jgi:hypothetical protein
MVRIARFAWDESLGPVSQVMSPRGDVWDLPPVERESRNPNSDAKTGRKSPPRKGRSRAHLPSEPGTDRAA